MSAPPQAQNLWALGLRFEFKSLAGSLGFCRASGMFEVGAEGFGFGFLDQGVGFRV